MAISFQSIRGMSDDDPQLSEVSITDGHHTCIAICPRQLCNPTLQIALPLTVVLDGKALSAHDKEVQIREVNSQSNSSPQAKAKYLGTCLELIGIVTDPSRALIEVGEFQFKIIGGIPKGGE